LKEQKKKRKDLTKKQQGDNEISNIRWRR
jgi:hypothetical protein